jgi:type III secretion protein R
MNTSGFDPITLAVILSGISLVPMLLVCTTGFLKISIVLLMVRSAMGVQQVPPTLALYGIAFAITTYVMAPTFEQITQRLADDPIAGTASVKNLDRLRHALEPLRDFMQKHAGDDQLDWFVDAAQKARPAASAETVRRTDLTVLIPAFIVSQLQAAYQIAVAIYIPFVVIEIIVSSVLLALGMQMVSPTVITIPLKLLLFVVVDGWTRLLHGLSLSFV